MGTGLLSRGAPFVTPNYKVNIKSSISELYKKNEEYKRKREIIKEKVM